MTFRDKIIISGFGIIPIGFTWLYLAPIVGSLPIALASNFYLVFPSLLRSLLFATAVTVISIPSAFLFALFLWRTQVAMAWRAGYWLIPNLVGSVTWAFLWKLMIVQCAPVEAMLADRSPFIVWALLILIQVWQFGPTSIFFYWLAFRGINTRFVRFGEIEGRSITETIRDVLWPKSKALTFLIILFVFSDAFQENSKLQIILRSSEATGTELVSNRLLENFQFYLPANPQFAVAQALGLSAVVAMLGLVCSFGLLFLLSWSISFVLDLVANGQQFHFESMLTWRHTKPRSSNWLIGGFSLLVMMPFLSLLQNVPVIDTGLLERIARAVVASFLCSISVVILSFGAATLLRIGWPHAFESAGREFLALSAISLALYFVPTLAVSLAGFYWLGLVAPTIPGSNTTVVSWFIGQVSLASPLLIVFVAYLNFNVPTREILYLQFSRASTKEVVRDSFLRRLRSDYVVVWLFGFSLVFTEASLNSILAGWSPLTPSVVAELLHRIDGRGSSYGESTTLILAALIPVLLTVILFARGLKRRESMSAN